MHDEKKVSSSVRVQRIQKLFHTPTKKLTLQKFAVNETKRNT